MVIIGGGFDGLAVARAFARHPVRMTLVDRENHHTFQPLLCQVGTNGAQIAYPVRAILRCHTNVDVILGEVTEIDVAARRIAFDGRWLDYDYVVSTGARHSYFGPPEWEALAPGLKTAEDALEIRRRVFLAFELPERDAGTGPAASGGMLNRSRAPPPHTAPTRTARPAVRTYSGAGLRGRHPGAPTGWNSQALWRISRGALPRDLGAVGPTRTRIVLEG